MEDFKSLKVESFNFSINNLFWDAVWNILAGSFGLGGSGTGSSSGFFLLGDNLEGETEGLFKSGFKFLADPFYWGLAGLRAGFFIFRKLNFTIKLCN